MKYVSEYTGKVYETVEACAEADKAYEEKLAAEKKAAEEFRQKKEALEKEIEMAYDLAMQTKDNYNALVKEYEEMFEGKDYDYECDCDDDCTCKCSAYKYENGKTEKIDISKEDVLNILYEIFGH